MTNDILFIYNFFEKHCQVIYENTSVHNFLMGTPFSPESSVPIFKAICVSIGLTIMWVVPVMLAFKTLVWIVLSIARKS